MTTQKNKYNVGDLVYFHAYSDAKDESSYFLCKGIVLKRPQEKKGYKIVIVSVDPKSVLCGERKYLAQTLLGRKIIKPEDKITDKPTGWMAKFYKEENWLEISSHNLKKIHDKIKKEK